MKGTKAKILDAAIKLFARNGYDRVGIRQIAKEAGINSSMISYYFASKENLYKTVLSLYLDEFKEMVLNLSIDDEKEFIKSFIKAHIAILKKRGKDVALIMAREHMDDQGRFKEFFSELLGEIRARLEHVFRKGIKRGIFKPISEKALTKILIGIDIIFAFKVDMLDEEQLANLAYDIFMNGIKES